MGKTRGSPSSGDGAEWTYRHADFAANSGWLRSQRNHQLEALEGGTTRLMITEIFTGFVWVAPVNDTRVHLERLLVALAARARELASR